MLIFGVLVSVFWLVGMGFILYFNLEEVVSLELNALGDFLAGGFAPLAFLWLVIGYFQQGKELKLSTDALILQAKELSNSVEQQRELVRATYEDIAFSKAESISVKQYEKRMAQPIFSLQRGGRAPLNGGGICFWFDVLNFGCEVKGVVVSVCSESPGKALYEIYDYEWLKWGVDKERTFWVGYELADFLELEWVAFNIVYLDGLGEKCAKKLSFGLRDGEAIGLDVSDIIIP